MKNPPPISVVMGIYNDADLLPETIDSVRAQTEADFECIIVNDGSTDPKVMSVLAGLLATEPRLRVLHKQKEGLTCALRDGCAAAQGRYIARIDVGDAMCPDRLERQRAMLDRHPELVFVSCYTDVCGPEWEPLLIKKEKDTGSAGMSLIGPAPARALRSGPTHHASVMFRRSAYEAAGGYRAEFYYAQDWDLWYRLAEQGAFHQLPEVLQRVRLLPQGISAQARRMQEELGRLALDCFRARQQGQSEGPHLQQAAAQRPDGKPAGQTRRIRQSQYQCFVGKLLLQNRDARCRAYFRKSVALWPFTWRAWWGLAQAWRASATGPERS